MSGPAFDDLTPAKKIAVLAAAGEYFDALDGDEIFARELAARGVPLASGKDGRVTWKQPDQPA